MENDFFLFSQAPSMSPLNVRADSLTEHSIRVRFDPIPPSHHNGPLQGYNLYYRNKDHHHDHEGTKITIGASERQVIIDGLETMKNYEISMTAFNDKEGPRSEVIEVVPGKDYFQAVSRLNILFAQNACLILRPCD